MAKRSSSGIKAVSKTQDTPLPPSLANARVTPRKLESQSYQKKIHSFYAKALLPRSYQKLLHLVDQENFAAIKLVMEAYGIIQSKSAVSIINQTNNVDARSLSIAEGEGTESGRRKSFASVVRELNSQREQRAAIAGPGKVIEANFVPTPEGISK